VLQCIAAHYSVLQGIPDSNKVAIVIVSSVLQSYYSALQWVEVRCSALQVVLDSNKVAIGIVGIVVSVL